MYPRDARAYPYRRLHRFWAQRAYDFKIYMTPVSGRKTTELISPDPSGAIYGKVLSRII
jgi:hypothetical protein